MSEVDSCEPLSSTDISKQIWRVERTIVHVNSMILYSTKSSLKQQVTAILKDKFPEDVHPHLDILFNKTTTLRVTKGKGIKGVIDSICRSTVKVALKVLLFFLGVYAAAFFFIHISSRQNTYQRTERGISMLYSDV